MSGTKVSSIMRRRVRDRNPVGKGRHRQSGGELTGSIAVPTGACSPGQIGSVRNVAAIPGSGVAQDAPSSSACNSSSLHSGGMGNSKLIVRLNCHGRRQMSVIRQTRRILCSTPSGRVDIQRSSAQGDSSDVSTENSIKRDPQTSETDHRESQSGRLCRKKWPN